MMWTANFRFLLIVLTVSYTNIKKWKNSLFPDRSFCTYLAEQHIIRHTFLLCEFLYPSVLIELLSTLFEELLLIIFVLLPCNIVFFATKKYCVFFSNLLETSTFSYAVLRPLCASIFDANDCVFRMLLKSRSAWKLIKQFNCDAVDCHRHGIKPARPS